MLGGRWESQIAFQSKTRHIVTFDMQTQALFDILSTSDGAVVVVA